ncbi:PREDICTED: uncharacterized protein LOC109176208 isoform X2 [Ipomoea nil]|uniref:uncharacterized protein LOC109176208 isoform X2 n=1 Tax=Ipomoea nil TaxID=35883 RepID=UPI0009016CC0|nr:PREDICTED: uncharacterized protein LOC109176208 isoform X2 [Ipomoea nil]
MAGALGTSLSLLLPSTPISRKHLSLKSSLSASNQRKPTKRKNYLREKILKTLTKPHPNFPLPVPIETPPTIDPLAPSESPLERIPVYPSVEVAGEEPKESEVQEVQVAQVSEPRLVNHGKSSALKLFSWLVAAVIVPTIYVRVFGSAGFDSKKGNFGRKNEKDEILEIGGVGNSKSKLKLFSNGSENGWTGLVDEAEMERNIEEVKMMAREARAMERIEAAKSSASDSGDGYEDDDSSVSNAIGKLPGSLVGYLMRNGERKGRAKTGGFDEKEMNAALLFKKKHKYRSFSGKPSDKPTGFTAPVKPNGEEHGQRRHVQTSEQGKRSNVSHGVGKTSVEEREKNSEGERQEVAKSVHGTSGVQDGSNQSILVEAPNNNEPSIPQTTVVSNKRNRSNRNLSSKGKKGTEKQSAKKAGSTNFEKETNFWWLSLPYILVVRMHISHDGKVQQRLYSLKSSSGDLSHIVAFEDRSDAANFCYILQSYFEDLEDFSTEIVLLSFNEHDESVKSSMENAIVVRKGQLKLYAGQPLVDVETTLRSFAAQI